jgi:hypothetical protein
MSPVPRLLPDQPLPPYTFVPDGEQPHPVRDPRGHSFRKPVEGATPPSQENWANCRAYLYGLDLFNAGYYWEAHEVWESLWHVAGRSSAVGQFLKGLIKLAAAGVKVRQGVSAGVRSHAQRAAALMQELAQTHGPRFLGLDLEELMRIARRWNEEADELAAVRYQGVQPIGGVALRTDACA